MDVCGLLRGLRIGTCRQPRRRERHRQQHVFDPSRHHHAGHRDLVRLQSAARRPTAFATASARNWFTSTAPSALLRNTIIRTRTFKPRPRSPSSTWASTATTSWRPISSRAKSGPDTASRSIRSGPSILAAPICFARGLGTGLPRRPTGSRPAGVQQRRGALASNSARTSDRSSNEAFETTAGFNWYLNKWASRNSTGNTPTSPAPCRWGT